jgi:two-component system chemotaxis response regulator CheB
VRTNFHKLKVTIANSSSYSRLVLSSILQAQPDLEVLDTAADELSLLASLRLKRPDVVLADLNLQNQNTGFFLRQVHLESGVPVLILCEKEKPNAAYLSKASQLGVYDYILKPAHQLQPKFRDLQNEILEKIRAVHKTKFIATTADQNAMVSRVKTPASKKPKGVVVIGASTGGTQAVENIIRNLNPKLDACILIAVHLPGGFTRSFAKRLQSLTSLKVVEGENGRKLQKGKIIIAPGGNNMLLTPGLTQSGTLEIKITAASETEYDKPSIDVLMKSVAGYYGASALGIVLTGMGKDGTKGLEAIKKQGGLTVAQDQDSSVIFGMAKSAIDKGHVKLVLPLLQIPAFINKYVAELPAVAKTLPTSI